MHADRIATIRWVESRYGVIVDPHTADGVKVGRALCPSGLPLICVETALPVKFAATILDALGQEPQRAQAYIGLEAKPQHVTALSADVASLKSFIAERALS